MSADRPSHIIDTADARKTRCGLKGKQMYPYVYAPFVQMHVEGHRRVGKEYLVCAECARLPVAD